MPPPRVQPRPIQIPTPRDRPSPADPAPVDAPPRVGDGFDVSTTTRFEITKDRQFTAGEIAAIKRRPGLGFAVENAQKSFKAMLDQGAKISVTTSAGNGGKP